MWRRTYVMLHSFAYLINNLQIKNSCITGSSFMGYIDSYYIWIAERKHVIFKFSNQSFSCFAIYSSHATVGTAFSWTGLIIYLVVV